MLLWSLLLITALSVLPTFQSGTGEMDSNVGQPGSSRPNIPPSYTRFYDQHSRDYTPSPTASKEHKDWINVWQSHLNELVEIRTKNEVERPALPQSISFKRKYAKSNREMKEKDIKEKEAESSIRSSITHLHSYLAERKHGGKLTKEEKVALGVPYSERN